MIHSYKTIAAIVLACLFLPGSTNGLSGSFNSPILEKPELAAYHGWIKYLSQEARSAALRDGPGSATAGERSDILLQWTLRILEDPDVLQKLRGVHEWAYESPVDGSGQPFKIMIPTDYNPGKPAGINLYMHGYAGNHMEHATGMAEAEGNFEISVLGRSRGGWYRGLSEADVLHVIDYVQAHWVTDLHRLHLSGGSMGGGGTFHLAARHPHRFASGRPTCGFAEDKPLGNLLYFPIYATHSADDWIVPVLLSRGPIAWINERGGSMILDETNGLGHAAWDYEEGNLRGAEWASRQVRPHPREVRHIDYTATDGGATRAWWAQIREWGDNPFPARMGLKHSSDGTLYATLTNIKALAIDIPASPFHAQGVNRVSINGDVPFDVPSSLGKKPLVLASGDGLSWEALAATGSEFPAQRLRTPGSAWNLYQGEPLIIVRGTAGDAPTTQAIKLAAEAASRSPHPTWRWTFDSSDSGPEGVPHTHLLYGNLPIRTDIEVTDEELTNNHIVLLGDVTQNQVAARFALDLPVRMKSDDLVCDDGWTIPLKNRAFALTCLNPLSPDRLLHWYASSETTAYAPEPLAHRLIASTYMGADLAVAEVEHPNLVATRRFNARWTWLDDDDDPLLPRNVRTHRDLSQLIAKALCAATGASHAILTADYPMDEPASVPGTTRLSTLIARFQNIAIGIMTLKGSELAELETLFAGRSGEMESAVVIPRDFGARLKAEDLYRIVIPVNAVWPLVRVGQLAPDSYRQLDLTVPDVLREFWPVLFQSE